MAFSLFNFGRDRGAANAHTASVDQKLAESSLSRSPVGGLEVRGLDISEPALFSPSHLNDRAHGRSRALREHCAECLASDPTLTEGFDKLAAHHLKIVLEGTNLLKVLLPDKYSPHSGEYYSTTRLDLVRAHIEELEPSFRTLHVHAALIAETEQPNPALQQIALEVGRDAVEFLERCRTDVKTLRAVSLREYPVGSYIDTMVGDLQTGEVTHVNDPSGYLIFQNRDVVRVNLRAVGEYQQHFHDLPFGKTDDGRHVIKQSGMLGCVGAATNMILMDYGCAPDLRRQYESHFDDDEAILRTLAAAGLRGEVVKVPRPVYNGDRSTGSERTLESIEGEVKFLERITAHGRGALLSINSEIGSHEIVIDRFSLADNRVTVRDPLHGWSIDVRPRAILSRLGFGAAVIVTDPRRG